MCNNIDILKYLYVIKNADESEDDIPYLDKFEISSVVNAPNKTARLVALLKVIAPLLDDYTDKYASENYEELEEDDNTTEDQTGDSSENIVDDDSDEKTFNPYDFIDSDNIDRVLMLAALYKFCNRNSYK